MVLAGEYAVLSQLMLKGFDAGLTLGKTKSIDILAHYPETGKIWHESKDSEDYKFKYFIVPSGVVAKYVKESHAFWLKKDSQHKDGDRRLFKIGLPNDRVIGIETPQAAKYENNWGFKVNGVTDL